MEYKTIRSADPAALDEAVTRLLTEGWDLFGTPYSVGDSICQALTKPAERTLPTTSGFAPFSVGRND